MAPNNKSTVGRNEVGLGVDDQTGDSKFFSYIDKDGTYFDGANAKSQKLAGNDTPIYEDHGFYVNEMQLVINETDLTINHEQF